MADTTFIDGATTVVAAWLNDVNDVTYTTVPALSTTVSTHTTQIATKAASGANTDITSLSAPALGAATATTQSPGDNTTKLATTAFVTTAVSGIVTNAQIQSISASVAASALTISASSLNLDFRSTTSGSGTVTTVSGTPSNLVISSGSTLGTVSAQQSNIVVIAINNAGTIELAAVNLAGGTQLDETNLLTTTAEGGSGAADSATVVYSTTARTGVAYRVIGVIRSTQTTAGAWVTAPSLIQGAGGNALEAMSSLGYGQSWQVVTGSRLNGATYYNTTGKPIQVQVYWKRGANTVGYITLASAVNGVVIDVNTRYFSTTDESINTPCFTVPPGHSYSVTQSGLPSTMTWHELR